MAPEMINSTDYGAPVDVYSLAILFWEMLTGMFVLCKFFFVS
jgi:serine/threonine protein kinase